jgi:type II secretory ATPase GspE/PulE/Tfp pilus assembly ATPase PilB-like protein
MDRWRQPVEILEATGLFDLARAEELLALARSKGQTVVEAAVAGGWAREEDLLPRLAEALDLPYVRGDTLAPEPAALALLPTATVFRFNVVPAGIEDGALRVVTSDPLRPGLADALRLASGRDTRFALAPAADIAKAAKRLYGVGAETLDRIIQDQPLELAADPALFNKNIDDLDQDASVVKFVNQIIWEAHQDGATDIHLEPQENDLRVRYRIDGVLHPTPAPAQMKRFQSAIISRVKVMAGMDIAEKRLPQDGRIGLRIRGEDIDVRVSTMPTVYGESVSLRLLLRRSGLLGMDKLGLNAEDEALLKRLITRPHGILLVTGPTGSGKSTSLYAWLHTINSVDKRVITIEEPIDRIGFPRDRLAGRTIYEAAGSASSSRSGSWNAATGRAA